MGPSLSGVGCASDPGATRAAGGRGGARGCNFEGQSATKPYGLRRPGGRGGGRAGIPPGRVPGLPAGPYLQCKTLTLTLIDHCNTLWTRCSNLITECAGSVTSRMTLTRSVTVVQSIWASFHFFSSVRRPNLGRSAPHRGMSFEVQWRRQQRSARAR